MRGLLFLIAGNRRHEQEAEKKVVQEKQEKIKGGKGRMSNDFTDRLRQKAE